MSLDSPLGDVPDRRDASDADDWFGTPITVDVVRGALDLERTERGTLPHRLPGWARRQILVATLPGRLRARVTDDIIGSPRSNGDWTVTRATVLAWVERGFVLVEAARNLNVHRNTLVHRLKRISSATGWPTTERRRWLALHLACVADGRPR